MKKQLFALSLGLLSTHGTMADPALTIYNQKFGVVRDTVHLDLKRGVNHLNYNEATMHLEPDSVVLRDPTGKRSLQILEQNFRADPVTASLLLNHYEGKTIDFETTENNHREIVHGKIIRSGYVPHQSSYSSYGQEYYQSQNAFAQAEQPIIEVDGKLRFSLPGQPLFPALSDDSILKPTLSWELNTDQNGPVDAEISYVTGGMSWQADYNLVAPEKGDDIDLIGWVTMDNQSGKSFEHAKIKLMAGDVNKIQPGNEGRAERRLYAAAKSMAMDAVVTEKAFDEFHLYTLERATTLLDRETKQVEFIHANGIKARTVYVYDGAKIDFNRYGGWNMEGIRNDRNYGTESNPKIWVMKEFTNSKTNQLGIPLPKGKLRFYRRDTDGQMEFTGENTIDHTPKDELIRVSTGDSFDLVGQRVRTDYKQDGKRDWADETFEIKLRNHKKEAVEIRVVEHLYRATNWQITEKSQDFKKNDAQTIEFHVPVKADGEETVKYTVHYSW